MLGKKKSVDDRFSDLWGKDYRTLCTIMCKRLGVIPTRLHQMGYSPSEGIWLLKLGVNPDAL